MLSSFLLIAIMACGAYAQEEEAAEQPATVDEALDEMIQEQVELKGGPAQLLVEEFEAAQQSTTEPAVEEEPTPDEPAAEAEEPEVEEEAPDAAEPLAEEE